MINDCINNFYMNKCAKKLDMKKEGFYHGFRYVDA